MTTLYRIEPQPQFKPEQLKEVFERLFPIAGKESFRQLVHRLNVEKYLYWDELKHRTGGVDLKPEEVWWYIKFIRRSNYKKIALKDISGKEFVYWLPDSLHKGLHFVDQKGSGHILVENPEFPKKEKEKYLISSLMEEAIASSQVEGAATTRPIAKEMLRTGRKPENESEQMILNNYETMLQIKELVGQPLSIRLLNELQAKITNKTLADPDAAGRFRNETEKERIKVWDDSTGELLFDPPPAAEIQERMQALCDFANNEEKYEFMHPLLKAMILHFWLAYVHPYVDGNGRTARALFYWQMLKSGYWMMEFISISKVLKKNITRYKKAFLYSEQDDRDMTYFLVFHLECIQEAFEELIKYLGRKSREAAESMQMLAVYPGINRRQAQLLHEALVKPAGTYTIESHMNVWGVSYETARTDLMDLESKGLLTRVTEGKTFVYIPVKDLYEKIKT
jgi:Fic family protein